ncbi:MAG: response regulator [Terriglobia bacterium]
MTITTPAKLQTILVVDDDPNLLQITDIILAKDGYSVAIAGSGKEALEVLQRKPIDLILLDVMLPDTDGYSLCQNIKGSPDTCEIPIILLTGLDSVENKVRGLDVGASDYLVKPFLHKELLARIRSHLRHREFAEEMKSRYSSELERAREVSILNRLFTEFNRSLDQSELLNHAAKVISTELSFEGCVIALWNEQDACLVPRVVYHPRKEPLIDPQQYSKGNSLMSWVAENLQPRVMCDQDRDPNFVRFFPETRSEMAVPLLHQDQILGVLCVENSLPKAYTDSHVELLSAIAGNLALALKNAELYSAAKLQSESLQSMVEQRTRELGQQKRFIECIIDSLPIGLYVIDRDYDVVTWNKKRETGIFGISRDRVIGRDIRSVFARMSAEKLMSEFESVFNSGVTFETEAISWSSGEKRYYHLRKIPMSIEGEDVTHVITLAEDISERKKMEESLAINEKLASIGKLAAGIAHEINNPLAAISGCVEGLLLRSKDSALLLIPTFEDFPEYLRIIEDEINRCKGIINNLLDFSRSRGILQEEIRINETLEQTLQLLSHHKEFKKIKVQKRLDEQSPSVVGNSGELRQVFLAMAINAMDAMDETGTLTVQTSREKQNDQNYVCIQFQDNGIGISQENINKIFDPFFTTKPIGKGTGLGLSICYGIVRSHQGFIRVESELGKGSTFLIYVPEKLRQEAH